VDGRRLAQSGDFRPLTHCCAARHDSCTVVGELSAGSEAEARSFAETRRTLLEALDRTEQDAHTQSAELIRAAERRAREITIQADQSAALIEEQLTYLTTQLDHVRVRVTAIRSRLVHDLQSAPPPPVSRAASQQQVDPRETPSVEYVSAAAVVAPVPPQVEPGATENDSLPETLRVLRAALESLNGQPTADQAAR
jgi:hypothetical protein